MSLLLNSLEFLKEQVTSYEDDSVAAIRRIRDRAYQIRSYASFNDVNITVLEDTGVCASGENNNYTEAANAKIEQADLAAASGNHSALLPPIPDIPGVDGDMLRNLLMSWFYAGYYTAKTEFPPSDLK